MASSTRLTDPIAAIKSDIVICESEILDSDVSDMSPVRTLTRRRGKETSKGTKRSGDEIRKGIRLEKCENKQKKRQLQAIRLLRKNRRFNYSPEIEALARLFRNTSNDAILFVNLLERGENEIPIFINMIYGNLASDLHAPLPEDDAKQITAQVLKGLIFLHDNGLAHRDLKPENILVAAKIPRWGIKISDVGLSKRTNDNNGFRSVGTKDHFASKVLGHDHIEDVDRANEVRDARAADMRSLGLTLLAMLCHDYPFNNRELLTHMHGSLFLSYALSSLNVSWEGRAFVETLLNVDASSHLSTATAIEHTWFSDLASPSQLSPPVSRNSSSKVGVDPSDDSSATDASEDSPMEDPPLVDSDAQSSRTLHPGMEGTISEPRSPAGIDLVSEGTVRTNATLLDGLREFHDKGVDFVAAQEYAKAELLRQAIDGRKVVLGPEHKETLASMQQLGIMYLERGRFSDAHKILQETSDAQKHILGETDQSTLCSNYWLSKALFGEGKLQAAHTIIDETSETQKFVLGIRHEDTLRSIYLGGQIYLRQNNYGAALVNFEQAIDAWMDILGPGHSLTLNALEALGYCLFKKQRHGEARIVLQQVVEVSSSQQALTYLHEVGVALDEAGDHTGAQAALEKVFERRKAMLGPEHEDTLETLFWLCSSLCDQQGKISEVRDLLQQVAKSSASNANKALALDQLHRIAESLWYQEDYVKAQSVFEEAVVGRSRLLGSRHPGTLRSRSWLARTVFMQGKYEKAKELLEKIELVQEALLGSDHLDTIYSRMTLTQILVREGGLYAAFAPLSQISDTFEQILGPTHPDTLICKHDLGALLTSLQKFKRANIVLQEILTVVKKTLGPTHEETLRAHVALGINFYEWGQFPEAAAQFHLAAGEQISNFGKHDRKTLETLFWIGRVLYAQKRYQECEGFWRQVADARRRLLGTENPDTQVVIKWLAYSLEKRRKWSDAAEMHKQVLDARQRSLGPLHEATSTALQDVKRCQKQSSSRWFWKKK
ncbi:uncharacterized protein BDV17DRAFT_166801 [Aspergillus undulatus]|uniref:uncharacterized protein n=1 Tax=Aspergillus undulatus TaxID=1810928 RepID=UPI003CCCE894